MFITFIHSDLPYAAVGRMYFFFPEKISRRRRNAPMVIAESATLKAGQWYEPI
jgi:hypothetical protein